jgi:hypothetical protein
MALIDGLISYWRLDESSGTRDDAHGANDLTDNNTVGSASGKIGLAADFNASASEYLSHADNADLSFADDAFTFTGWFNIDSASTRSVVAKWGSDGAAETCEYALRTLSGGTLNWRVGNGSGNVSVSHSATLATGQWYFFAAYHDPAANQIGLSLDGGTAQTASITGGILDGAASFAVGRTGDFAGQYWDGLIDEVGLWGRVLSASEITELYASGAGLAYPFSAGATAGPRRRRHRPAEAPFDCFW